MSDKYNDLEKLNQEMLTCTMCGFCKNVCPVFLDVGWDTGSPRGRMTMAYGLVSGELEMDDDLVNRIYQCTQCQDCSRRCPSGVECPDVVLAARREMVRRGKAGEDQIRVLNNVKETGNIYADLEVEFPEQEGEIPLFIGCQHLSRPNSTKRSIKVLERLGIKPKIVKEVCCGFPLHLMGFEEEHEKQVERLKETFSVEEGPILTFCPGCKVHLEEAYGLEVRHVLEEINDRLDENKVTRPLNKKVTYHDPCDLSRGAGITKEPREIIRKLGAELVEMNHSGNTSRCCGGGGSILTWDAEISDRLSATRMHEALNTGAEMVITACPTCEQTLRQGAKELSDQNGGKPMPVQHLMDLIFRATR